MDEHTQIIANIAQRALVGRDELRTQVQAHMKLAKEICDASTFLDGELAENIGKGCLALLDLEPLPEASERLIMAACVYYVEDDDESGDFDEILGFEDDALVFNEVARQLGHAELVIKV
ncbi:MAG: hypothetical protein R3F61_37110 [Myxococcota bacterium]